MKKTLRALAAAALAALALTAALPAGAAEETVRVGCFPQGNFFEWDAGGILTGYGAEYTNLIAEQAGWDVEYVSFSSWEAAQEGLAAGEIDLLAPGQYTADRAERFDFSSFSIGTEYGALLALESSGDLTYEDYETLDGMRVGCVDGQVFQEAFADYMAVCGFRMEPVYYPDSTALLAALNRGEVDVILTDLMRKADHMKVLAKFAPSPFYYMTQKGRGELLGELNTAINQYTAQYPDTALELEKKYFPFYAETPFTRAELAAIQALSPIRVGCRADFAPLSGLDEKTGTLSGIDIDLLDRIAQDLGVEFQYVPLPTDEVSYAFLQENHIRLVMDVEHTGVNAAIPTLRLSEPYITLSKVFVGRRDTVYDLTRPLTVAVASASGTLERTLHSWYPAYTVQKYRNAEECLEAIRRGEADLMLENRYVVETVLAKPRYEELTILPAEGLGGQLCISTIFQTGEADREQTAAEIIGTLNKAISHISRAEIERICSVNSVRAQYRFTPGDFFYRYRCPLAVLGAALAALAAALANAARVRRRERRAMEAGEQKLRNITDTINGGVVVARAGAEMEILYANGGFLELIGRGRGEFEALRGRSCLAYVHPEDAEMLRALLADDAVDRKVSGSMRLRQEDGSYLNTLFTGTVTANPDGEREVYCVVMDMTRQMQLTEQLRIENARTNLLLERADASIYEIYLETGMLNVSRSLQEKLGWSLPSEIGEVCAENVARALRMPEDDVPLLREALGRVMQGKESAVCQARLTWADGTDVWCRLSMFPVLSDNGEIVSVMGEIRNVDQQVRKQKKLEEQSQLDPLTRLYNKETFRERAEGYLDGNPDTDSALIFLDLDNFKAVNDTLGHLAGDRALCGAAHRMQLAFSNYDIIARFGGDEFCALVKDIPLDTLRGKLDWLLKRQACDYTDGESTVHVTCSIGVARTRTAGTDYQRLLACADKAMYAAKERGRNGYVLYEDDLQ